ncbi:MAG: ATP-binding cassette domain-containing protein [Bacteroidales bacterium]|jgi:ABC-2 type transport system ATP-binding protein|nr:ATP-binding cassette domain-containing protein [Bacteroidales bacterium]
MKFIEVQNVSKSYAKHKALDDVSLSIEEGIIYGLLGPNGAGKTTLIRILNQITAPDTGQVFFQGNPLKSTDIEKIGYLPEERGLYKKMKVGEQAIYLAQLKGLSKLAAADRLIYWFKKFDMENWWHRKIEELSKGMQQKVQFITTIIHNPKFLIFDEPFSGFDPINTTLLRNEMLELKKQGTTIILSTHNMASVEEICDEIALINRSKKILEGKITDLKHQFKQHRFEIQLTGCQEYALEKLAQHYTILSHRQEDEKQIFMLKTDEQTSANRLLETAMPLGEIVAFNELLPSMNEIFIQQVQYSNSSNNE